MSEAKRLFSHDPVSGISKYFQYNESSSGRESEDTFTISSEQNVRHILDENSATFNSTDERARWGEGQRVAYIPLAVWQQLKQDGIADDEKRFKAWLNDSDNRQFRTRPGRV